MEIELPDGTVLDAPDDADPSVVAKAYLAKNASAAMPIGGHGPIGQRPAQWSQFNPVVAAGEGALQLGTAAGAGILGSLSYAGAAAGRALGITQAEPKSVMGSIQNALIYQPASPSSQLVERAARTLFQPAVKKAGELADTAATQVGQVSPTAETYLREAPAAFQAATGVFPVLTGARPALAAGRELFERAPLPSPEDVLARMASQSQENMGAAAAAPSLTNVSPELRQAISTSAQKTGGAVNPEALARHIEAESLPVPVRLTEGQALQDPMIISQEMNTRGSNGVMVEHMDDTNKRLGQNVQAIRDEIGPEVFSTNAPEHGDTLIAAYRAKNDAAQANISAKYQALENANGGAFPIDAKTLLQSASQQLHKKLIFEHAPKSVMGQLERMAKDGMTFEQFEAMRTNLATIQRTATDGLEKKAAGVIRSEMEKLPLTVEAKDMKSLADEARAAARAQFDALEADPAYDAAVNDTVSPDRFVSRFVINGDRDNVALMRQNLAGDERAIQTMGVAALDHLRDAARLNPHYQGNFAAASFNKGLRALSPKLSSLVSPQTAEQLEKLGNVARYTTAQPRGSLVNNSNSAVASMADYGAKAAEQVMNAKAGGLPVGTVGRRVMESMTRNRNARRAIVPGAGLGSLSPQMQQMLVEQAKRQP